MAKNWLNTPSAVMSNPLGEIERGWDEICGVYQNIFDGPASVYVEYHEYTVFEGDRFFQTVGREKGQFERGDKRIELAIRTSRLFVLQEGRYRQLHHHGSIDNPTLLATYQNTVLNNAIA